MLPESPVWPWPPGSWTGMRPGTMTTQSTVKETNMTTHIDTEDLIRDTLLWHYENIDPECWDTDEETYQLLKALRKTYNYFSPVKGQIKRSKLEKKLKKKHERARWEP